MKSPRSATNLEHANGVPGEVRCCGPRRGRRSAFPSTPKPELVKVVKRSPWWVVAVLAVLAGAGRAHAEPCVVTIVRAPPTVRATVERWIASERCGTPLTVRIIPTEGQLYLFAQDDRGRVHERVVPDADSAGLLIASWTAVPALVGTPARSEPEPDSGPVDGAPVAWPVTEPSPVSALATIDAPPPRAVATHRHNWLTFAIGVGSNEGYGARGELEMIKRGGFSADLQLELSSATLRSLADPQSAGTYVATFQDASAMLGARYTWRFDDRWHIRAGVAAGAVTTRVELTADSGLGSSSTSSGSAVTALAEAAVLLGYALGDRWEVEVGPVGTLAPQRWYMVNQMETLTRNPGGVLAFAGLRRAL